MQQILHESDIQWVIRRLPLVEHTNTFLLDEWRFIEFAQSLQREVRALRALAHASIEECHRLTRELEQQRRQTARLRDEVRHQRQQDDLAA